MKVVTVIQARMSSSRLTGKVLMTLFDRPVIAWVYERASRISGTDGTVVATTTSVADDAVATWCERHGITVFRGSEHDVLDRYVECAKAYEAGAVVRITADCPLLDPTQSSRVVAAFLDNPGCEYASNTQPRTFPKGLDTEIVAREALEACAREATETEDREHVTPLIRRSPDRFSSRSVLCDRDLGDRRWTLDELADFTFLSAVAGRLGRLGLEGSLDEVLAVLEAEPELSALNAGVGTV